MKIKIHIGVAILAFFACLRSDAQTSAFLPAGQNLCESASWKRIFYDDFNGNNLDRTKWVTFNNHCWTNETVNCLGKRASYNPNSTNMLPSILLDQNVIVNGGFCYLVVKKEPSSIPWYGHMFDFSSGMIATKLFDNDRSGLYERGRFEARIKFSGSHNIASCFWLYSGGKWGRSHEIDIAEYNGNRPKVMTYSLHNNPSPKQGIDFTHERRAGVNWSKDFHLYRVDWDLNFIQYYIDNTLISTVPRLNALPSYLPYYSCTTGSGPYEIEQGFFHVDESAHLIINTGLSDGKMYSDQVSTVIDYVAIYQRSDCEQNVDITNSNLFPREKIKAGNIKLGTRGNPNQWNNIISEWETGHYQANSIEISPNFISYPDYSSTSHTYNAFLYEAITCPGGALVPPQPEEPLGDYSTVPDTDPCSDVDTAYVRMLIDSAILISDTASLDEIYNYLDSVGCTYFASGQRINRNLGILQNESFNKFRIYPNPSNGSFSIELVESDADYDIRITDVIGSVVYQGSINHEKRKNIQLNRLLPPGNYTIQVSNKEVRYMQKLSIVR